MAYTTPGTLADARQPTTPGKYYDDPAGNTWYQKPINWANTNQSGIWGYTPQQPAQGTTYVRPRTTDPRATSWMRAPQDNRMDPWNEARRSADLKYTNYKRAVDDAVALLQSEGNRAVDRAQGYARQEMADQGLLSSTNAVDKAVDYGTKAYSPYQQQIAQQQGNLQAYGNQLAEDAALMYQQLGRSARDEQRTDRNFQEMVRQFGVNAALQWWDALSAKELGLEQLNPDYKPSWPSIPTAMVNSLYKTPGKGYGPTGDYVEPERGCGPKGDATDKFTMAPKQGLGKSGARQQLDQNAAFHADSVAQANADRQMQDKRLSLEALTAGYTYDPTSKSWVKTGAGGTDPEKEAAFKQALMAAAWQPAVDANGNPTGGYTVPDVGALTALANAYGFDLKNYTGMLPESIAKPLRTQRRAIANGVPLKPNALVAADAARDNKPNSFTGNYGLGEDARLFGFKVPGVTPSKEPVFKDTTIGPFFDWLLDAGNRYFGSK